MDFHRDFNKLTESADSQELGIYVGFPFCSSKCHYCQWVARVPTATVTRSHSIHHAYTEAVIQQIDAYFQKFGSEAPFAKDIFFGGGTPTILEAQDLVEVLERLKSRVRVTHETSITVEASPDTVDVSKLRTLREGGFDRLSMGLQSFDDDLLRRMGRKATSADSGPAVKAAREAGFANLNLDLMYGLPGESESSWRDSVQRTLDLGTNHMSIYRYNPVGGTIAMKLLENRPFDGVDPAQAFARYQWAYELLTSLGYREYAEGLFTNNGLKCACDEVYFRLSHPWLGFGAGSNSFFAQKRWITESKVEKFIEEPTASYGIRGDEAVLYVAFFQMLRTDGIDVPTFEKRFGLSWDQVRLLSKPIDLAIRNLVGNGSLVRKEGSYQWKSRMQRSQWFNGLYAEADFDSGKKSEKILHSEASASSI